MPSQKGNPSKEFSALVLRTGTVWKLRCPHRSIFPHWFRTGQSEGLHYKIIVWHAVWHAVWYAIWYAVWRAVWHAVWYAV